ncbi:Aminotransferase-like [Abeliophyllum distichum]|uniref:Aminotransferase-like n=1 Tax=Abeliophyllum distichum TaxID=126358 RepID=A0ABD1QMY0_9LAMI
MAEGDRLVTVREEEMSSLGSGFSFHRIAYFLRPSVTSVDGPVFAPPLDSANQDSTTSVDDSVPIKAIFSGWRCPRKEWIKWVDRMRSMHLSTWKQAGIDDAITNSTFQIHRSDELILGVAEKWCSGTNTFVFPWGEATITLEDMIFLGSFSVLGNSVLSRAGDVELEVTTKKLREARLYFSRTTARKASPSRWIEKFMECGSEIEHEAFLAYWVSQFVFPYERDTISKAALPIAASLARGTKLALAPAVLADIYRNLSALKGSLVASKKCGTGQGQKEVIEVKVTAPFQLVQAWVWERFPTLRPMPNSTGFGEPRLARWNGIKKVGTKKVLSAVDGAEEEFIWRPYMRAANNCLPHMVYKEEDYWVLIKSGSGDEFEGLVRCLRPSELVSPEVDCIEQYLPHRVAMQFGMDQDLPGHVMRENGSSEIAWSNYTRKIEDGILYIPARLFESDATTRYLKWWHKLEFARSVRRKVDSDGKSRSRGFRIDEGLLKVKSEDDDLPPPGFPPKLPTVEAGISGSKTKETYG